jgi:elongation factor P--beta-lysine ligase
MYTYRKYNKELQKALFYPILVEMMRRKITYKKFVSICAENGLKTSESSLRAIQKGNNYYAEHFNLFTKMYEILNLPPITLDYLIECREQYNKLRPQRKVK